MTTNTIIALTLYVIGGIFMMGYLVHQHIKVHDLKLTDVGLMILISLLNPVPYLIYIGFLFDRHAHRLPKVKLNPVLIKARGV